MTPQNEGHPTRDWQRVEGAGMALGGMVIAGVSSFGPWWAWLLVLVAPEISAAAYLAGPRIGAFVYNLTHLYAASFLLMILGVGLGATLLIAVGGLWLAHIGISRAMGFGLKYPSGYRDTHLGRIGL